MKNIYGKSCRISIAILLLTSVTAGCHLLRPKYYNDIRDYKIRDLTDQARLNKIINSQNDTVCFHIDTIKLYDVEWLKPGGGQEHPGGMAIKVGIYNNSDEVVAVQLPEDHYDDCAEGKLYFKGRERNAKLIIYRESRDILIAPKKYEKIDLSVRSHFLSFLIPYDSAGTNIIEPVLDLIRDMEFYYVPPEELRPMGSDTIVLDRRYRLAIDENTKVISWSLMR